MSLVLEWNILDDRGREGWEAMPMLAYAAIKGGHCSYAYPERLEVLAGESEGAAMSPLTCL